jgi:hypothetical protein
MNEIILAMLLAVRPLYNVPVKIIYYNQVVGTNPKDPEDTSVFYDVQYEDREGDRHETKIALDDILIFLFKRGNDG